MGLTYSTGCYETSLIAQAEVGSEWPNSILVLCGSDPSALWQRISAYEDGVTSVCSYQLRRRQYSICVGASSSVEPLLCRDGSVMLSSLGLGTAVDLSGMLPLFPAMLQAGSCPLAFCAKCPLLMSRPHRLPGRQCFVLVCPSAKRLWVASLLTAREYELINAERRILGQKTVLALTTLPTPPICRHYLGSGKVLDV